tara:strand:- start:148 stop:732 length:585 start_codon:yes stop_codon:yes gene_type:complete
MYFKYNKNVLKNEKNRYLNIGAGNVSFDKISNTDIFPSLGQLIKGNLKRNSNLNNKYYLNIFKTEKSFKNQWDGIVLSHVLEHINPKFSKMVLKILKSYLKSNGYLRILVPDPKVYFYENSSLSPQGYRSNILSLNSLFYGWSHCFMYSETLLIEILKEIGFKEIEVVKFGKGNLSEFDFIDRKYESLCIVAKK